MRRGTRTLQIAQKDLRAVTVYPEGVSGAEAFPITITSKLRHGILWLARQLCGGTNTGLAAYLGVGATELGTWMNLKRMPQFRGGPLREKRRKELNDKLLLLVGKGFDDVFPQAIRESGWLEQSHERESTHEIEVNRFYDLTDTERMVPAQQEADYTRKELKASVSKCLGQLTPREEKVLRMRFGIGEDDEDVDEKTLMVTGQALGVTRERIREIEGRALRKLRHPRLSRALRPFVRGDR